MCKHKAKAEAHLVGKVGVKNYTANFYLGEEYRHLEVY